MSTPIRPRVRDWVLPALALAAVVYPPLLLAAPGQVVADTDVSLALDPSRLLSRLFLLWDPDLALGTVPDQRLGLLWPTAPFFWLCETVGVPAWASQRLWVGTLILLAGIGVLALARAWRWPAPAAAAAAFAYALSPAVLALAAPRSVQLLPLVGLPWLLCLTVRALHTRGWRHPVLFGLTLATVGSTNASSVPLLLLVPTAWLVYVVIGAGTVRRSRSVTTVLKLASVTAAVNLWWVLGASVAATDGINVLDYTVTPEVVAGAAAAGEVLRGLGNWRFYDLGPADRATVASIDYTQRLGLLIATYVIPVLGVLGLGIVRWRHRGFLVALALVGLLVAVGAHPWGDPAPIGQLLKLAQGTELGLGLRSLHRATPLVALALALGAGTVVAALGEQSTRRGVVAAVAVAAVAVGALPPLWNGGLVPEDLRRPQAIPDPWLDAAAVLQTGDQAGRILELPGTAADGHEWGPTAGPVLAALVDRPHVERRLAPQGTTASADLLRAFDIALQEQTLSPSAIAPVARLLGATDIVIRGDDIDDDTIEVHPHEVWDLVSAAATTSPGSAGPGSAGPESAGPESAGPESAGPGSAGSGLTGPLVFGSTAPAPDDEALLARTRKVPVPAVAIFGVDGAVPVVRAVADDRTVLLSGDGAGLVDAAAAGLLDGTELVRYSASITDDEDFVVDELIGERALVITDGNRRRAQRWDELAFSDGYTERADGGVLRDDPLDRRLHLLDDRPGTQTVADHVGVSVRATSYGRDDSYEPAFRPASATDGDVTTAWRVGGGVDATGERIELTLPEPVTTDRFVVLQPGPVSAGAGTRGQQWITEVVARFDGGDPLPVRLGSSSRLGTAAATMGQTIRFPVRSFQTLSIEIVSDTAPNADAAAQRPALVPSGAAGVGFAEIRVGGVGTDEVIRMPTDLIDAGGYRTHRYPLALVATRQRSAPTDVRRHGAERRIERVFSLPSARSFAVAGTARLAGGADAPLLDSLLGRSGPTVRADSRLPGGFAHLPSNVLDGDATTWWTSSFDPRFPTLSIETADPVPVGPIRLVLVDDAAHALPHRIRITVDGTVAADVRLQIIATGSGLTTVEIPMTPTIGTRIEIRLAGIGQAGAADGRRLPVAVAEVELAPSEATTPTRVGPVSPLVDSGCRDDLVRIDGVAVPVQVTGTTEAARAGLPLSVRGCGAPTALGVGEHRLSTTPGSATGLDVDQVVWRSAAGGAADTTTGPIVGATGPGDPIPGDPVPNRSGSAVGDPQLLVTSDDATTITATVTDARADEAFWVVLGQSHTAGWSLEVDEGSASGPHLVAGYANGWLVTPGAATFDVRLRFVPQNRVDIGLLVSLIGVAAALALLALPSREVRPMPIPLTEPLRRLRALTYEGALPTRRHARLLGLGAGVASFLVAGLLVGIGVGVLTGFTARREGWRPLLTVLPAGILAFLAAVVTIGQYRNDFAPGPTWPAQVADLHPVGLAAVLLLAADVAVERVWTSRSDYR